MPHKIEKIWDALPPEYHKPGAHAAEMAIVYIDHQKSVIGRLTRAFTGASEAMVQKGNTPQVEEVSQSIKDLWKQKEELEIKLAILTLERAEVDSNISRLQADISNLQKNCAENIKRIDMFRKFATTVRSLTGHTVPVTTLVEIAEDVLNKTA
jgi:septal ring factor EnvC (AmiA/AmiB activator)